MTGNLAIAEMPKPKQEKKKRKDRGTGWVYRRGKIWWFQFSIGGRKFRETAKTEIKTEAQDKLRTRLESYKQFGASNAVDKNLTYEQMREYLYLDYATQGNKSLEKRADGTLFISGVAPQLDDFFSGFKAKDISVGQIKRFIITRKKEGVTNSTINNGLRMLRRMFKLQQKEQHYPQGFIPPITELPADPHRRDFLTPSDYAKLIAVIHPDSKPLLTAAYFTGARLNELLKLKWEDVDLGASVMLFRNTKNNENRESPIVAPVRKVLEALRTEHPQSVFVFVRKNGQPIKTIRKAWLAALKRTGLQAGEFKPYRGHLFHGNRRSMVVNLAAAGIDSQLGRELSGHKDATVYESYRQLGRANRMAAAEAAAEVVSVGHRKGTATGRRKVK